MSMPHFELGIFIIVSPLAAVVFALLSMKKRRFWHFMSTGCAGLAFMGPAMIRFTQEGDPAGMGTVAFYLAAFTSFLCLILPPGLWKDNKTGLALRVMSLLCFAFYYGFACFMQAWAHMD
jgi:hypothetical protein